MKRNYVQHQVKLPSEIEVGGNFVITVDNSKLIRVTLDNKLNLKRDYKQKNVQFKSLVLYWQLCKNLIFKNFYFTLL